ncbi:MAG: dienelactone hydrolase family protein [Smithellaceae bacterium]|nr:dienelactone hydrolase family protein [Smithellaceae bacterium]
MRKFTLLFFFFVSFLFLSCAGQSIKFPLNEKLNLTGDLSKPEGNGPFPAVIILHGCAGIGSNLGYWEYILVKEGYAVFTVDSLGPRGVGNICFSPLKVSPLDRAHDAFAAKRHLQTLPFIDKERIAVMGFSHGGWTALYTTLYPYLFEKEQPFKAVITFYPYCENIYPEPKALFSPLMILIGGSDDWTPAKACEAYPKILKGLNHEFVLKVYPGAYHHYDSLEERRVSAYGHTIERNESAVTNSTVMVKNFLKKHFER